MILTRFELVPALVAAALTICIACAQTAPPDLPKETITANLRVQIAPEIRASVERDLERLFDDEKELF